MVGLVTVGCAVVALITVGCAVVALATGGADVVVAENVEDGVMLIKATDEVAMGTTTDTVEYSAVERVELVAASD